jgi:hypothetical protein
MHVIGAGQRRHVDQPIAEPSGHQTYRIARAGVAAGQQPIDDIGGNEAAQPGQVIGGGNAFAVIHPEADDRGPRVLAAGKDLHKPIRADSREGGNLATRPRLAQTDSDAVAKNEAVEQS